MLKRITALFLALCLAISLAGCVSNPATPAMPADAETAASSAETSESLPGTVSMPDGSSFEIHFIDVGQADAALILCDGQSMLIDGGNSEDSSLFYAYLENHGVDYLDYIICTHAHEDHVGGLSGALNYATVGTAFCSVAEADTKAFNNFVKYLNEQGKEITVPSPGDTFAIGSASATILGPISYTDDPNNMSIVVKLVYGNTSFLFTGDAETVEEDEILDAGYDVSCTVLKVGHHGSSTSTGYRWLREAAPQYAVISVGEDNSYGHPHEETLSKLRDADVTVYRTDMQGNIICTSDGNTVTFTVEKNAAADTLSGAGEGGNHTEETTPEGSDPAAETITEGTSGEEMTYICNTSTGKFHYPDCSSVEDMSESNKLEVTATRDELIAEGYTPCGRCKP